MKVNGIGGWWYAVAFLVPAFGAGSGVYWFAKSQVGPGIALWAMAVAGAIIWFGVFLGIAVGDLVQNWECIASADASETC